MSRYYKAAILTNYQASYANETRVDAFSEWQSQGLHLSGAEDGEFTKESVEVQYFGPSEKHALILFSSNSNGANYKYAGTLLDDIAKETPYFANECQFVVISDTSSDDEKNKFKTLTVGMTDFGIEAINANTDLKLPMTGIGLEEASHMDPIVDDMTDRLIKAQQELESAQEVKPEDITAESLATDFELAEPDDDAKFIVPPTLVEVSVEDEEAKVGADGVVREELPDNVPVVPKGEVSHKPFVMQAKEDNVSSGSIDSLAETTIREWNSILEANNITFLDIVTHVKLLKKNIESVSQIPNTKEVDDNNDGTVDTPTPEKTPEVQKEVTDVDGDTIATQEEYNYTNGIMYPKDPLIHEPESTLPKVQSTESIGVESDLSSMYDKIKGAPVIIQLDTTGIEARLSFTKSSANGKTGRERSLQFKKKGFPAISEAETLTIIRNIRDFYTTEFERNIAYPIMRKTMKDYSSIDVYTMAHDFKLQYSATEGIEFLALVTKAVTVKESEADKLGTAIINGLYDKIVAITKESAPNKGVVVKKVIRLNDDGFKDWIIHVQFINPNTINNASEDKWSTNVVDISEVEALIKSNQSKWTGSTESVIVDEFNDYVPIDFENSLPQNIVESIQPEETEIPLLQKLAAEATNDDELFALMLNYRDDSTVSAALENATFIDYYKFMQTGVEEEIDRITRIKRQTKLMS